jgi:rhizosphere induced protein
MSITGQNGIASVVKSPWMVLVTGIIVPLVAGLGSAWWQAEAAVEYEVGKHSEQLGQLRIQVGHLAGQVIDLESRVAKARLSTVPVGTIVPYAGEFTPEALTALEKQGWLPCNGITKTRAEFPQLFAVLENNWGNTRGSDPFRLPDLRGVFIRGLDSGAGVDPDSRQVGTRQAHAVAQHLHTLTSHSSSRAGQPGLDVGNVLGYGAPQYAYGPEAIRTIGTYDAQSKAVGQETRPTNVAVNYVIKF